MIPHIHRKLIRWGNWVKTQQAGVQAYPKSSPLYKQIVFGTVVGVPIYYQIEEDELSREGSAVNAVVEKLEAGDITILREFYVKNGPIKEKARRLGVPRSSLYDRVTGIQLKIKGAFEV